MQRPIKPFHGVGLACRLVSTSTGLFALRVEICANNSSFQTGSSDLSHSPGNVEVSPPPPALQSRPTLDKLEIEGTESHAGKSDRTIRELGRTVFCFSFFLESVL